MTKARRKSLPDAVVLEKRKMAKEKREIVATKLQVGKHLEEDILNKHSIFSDSEDDEIRLLY